VIALKAALGVDKTEAPGRSCPLHYRYSPSVFNRPAELNTSTLYVVGGLYGNPEALDAVEAMFAREAADRRMVFNGDFHWFDAEPALFGDINARVHRHHVLRGNVETELANDDSSAGCGCAYPDDVDESSVQRSNLIADRLRSVSRNDEAQRMRLARLPMHAVAQVGGARVGIVHGDAESLAGWRFDGPALAARENQRWLESVFEAAQVNVFASTHTCAPALHLLHREGPSESGMVVNNGAAGMANPPLSAWGLITRISEHPAPAGVSVVREQRAGTLRVQIVEVRFDAVAWRARFELIWPPRSPAHASYWQRINTPST
jgi:hypothetical protein